MPNHQPIRLTALLLNLLLCMPVSLWAQSVPVPSTGAAYGNRASRVGGATVIDVVTEQALQRYDPASKVWKELFRPTNGTIAGWQVDPDTGEQSWVSTTHFGALAADGKERFSRTLDLSQPSGHPTTSMDFGLACFGIQGHVECTREGKVIKTYEFGHAPATNIMMGMRTADELWVASPQGLDCRRLDNSTCAATRSWNETARRFSRSGSILWLLTDQALWKIEASAAQRLLPMTDKQVVAATGAQVAVIGGGKVMILDALGVTLHEIAAPDATNGIAFPQENGGVWVLAQNSLRLLTPMTVSKLSPVLGTPEQAASKLGRAPTLQNVIERVREYYVLGRGLEDDPMGRLRARALVPQLSVSGSAQRNYDDRESVSLEQDFIDGVLRLSDPYSEFAYGNAKTLRAEIALRWDLERLVYDAEELSLHSAWRTNIKFSEDTQTRAINFYAEWKQKLVELTTPGDPSVTIPAWLRVEVLEGYLDVLTGGWFTTNLR